MTTEHSYLRGRARVLAAVMGLMSFTSTAEAQAPARDAADGCPSWARDLHSNTENPDLGCINRENLGKMVARPSDLTRGRTLGPANGARESLGVSAYEQGKIKSFGTEQSMAPAIIVPGGSGATP